MQNKTGILLLMVLLSGCIKYANLNYRTPTPYLVVEGMLLTDSTPCKVTLTYSGLFIKQGYQDPAYINDATVYLKDDANDSTKLSAQGNGLYQSDGAVHAQVGHSYSLSITLSNGKRYASFPEKIAAVSKDFSLDSIGESVPFGLNDLYGADIKIRTKDPAGVRNYYRWTSVDYMPRKATGVYCGSVPPCFQYCFQSFTDQNTYILSDAALDGADIRYQTALISPYYYYGKHYIEMKQLSLTENAYEFWNQYGKQTTATGGILDPIPSSIQGNIYSLNDSTELALGYFEASDVASFKLVVAPSFINSYYTLRNFSLHVATGACYLVYPDAMTDAPTGWENAPEYIVNVY
ncbi:MAG TPA: DUF4249 domain-containing protein [Chitinophagaceae bacterium]|nr:DUF4249 domain-containing protein [Chitinophagaceae bacterium]